MLLVLAGVSLKCQLMGGMITVNSSRCLPTFLILGAQKCGTTSLARALARNPHIFLPSAKEAHYFGEVADEDIDAATYSQFFSGWSHEPVIGEATPEYLALPGAASQIHRLLPDVRCVVIVRNPVDRAYSHYWHRRREAGLTLGFGQALAEEEAERQRGNPVPLGYLDRGRYAQQLTRFFDAGFASEQFLVLSFDDLISDPSSQVRRVEYFLGVEPSGATLPHENRSTRSVLPAALEHRLSGLSARRSLVQRAVRAAYRIPLTETMDPVIRAELVEVFRQPNEALGRLLGRDFASWNR